MTIARPLRQKLYGARRIAMLNDYLNHEKLTYIQALYDVDMSAPSGMLKRYGITPNIEMGRRNETRHPRTNRDWLIVFIAVDNEKEIEMLRGIKAQNLTIKKKAFL